MKTLVTRVLAAVLAFGTPAVLAQQCDETSVEEVTQPPAAAPATGLRADQILLKGVVGNLLEAVPMDPEQRVGLQRGNAVISAPMTARSLALLIGIANPVVMIGGLIYGIWAASRIEAPAQQAKAPAEPTHVRTEVLVSEVVAGD